MRQPLPAVPRLPLLPASWRRRLAALALAIQATFALPALGAGEPPAPPLVLSAAQVQALGVRSTPATPAGAGGASLSRLPATVNVPLGQLRMVAAPAAGLVESVKVVPGQQVRKGEVLATFASPELLALQRDASIARSQAELAASARRRDEALYNEGIIPASRLEATRASAAQAAAQSEEKRLSLGVAGLSAATKSGPGAAALTAPLSGYVLEQMATPGQRVDAAAPLFSLAETSALGLEIQVAASLAALLPDGAPVTATLADGRSVRGKVVSVGRQVGAAQTVAVRASLERPAAGTAALPLRPGQAVEAEIGLAGLPALAGAVRIPGAALTYRSGAASPGKQVTTAYVFVAVQEDARESRFMPQPVTVLGPVPGGWLVKSAGGAPLGDKSRVAAAGVAALKAAWLGQSAE